MRVGISNQNSNWFEIVIAGHSRPKDGVASARLCPAIHLKRTFCEVMDARIPSTPRLRRALGVRPPKLRSEGGKSGHDERVCGHTNKFQTARVAGSHSFAISPRMRASFSNNVSLSEIRGRRECRALVAPAALCAS
jgi:hypothetical protein